MVRMGCGTSQNAVAPLAFIENQNGSALRINSTSGTEVLDYLTSDELKQADDRAIKVNDANISVEKLTERLTEGMKNKAMYTRSFFKWITKNIRYDPQCEFTDVQNVISNKKCSAEGYVELFECMCRLSQITVIRLNSHLKSYSFVIDYGHIDSNNNIHMWNAVLINDTYHYIDCAWAAIPVKGRKTGSNDTEDIDHFFFTSPDVVGDFC